jgi:threonylcarbamoyladenosine tRNA methylthiotransferase MtaB
LVKPSAHIRKDRPTLTFAVTTLGCKVNQYESEAIARQLKKAGSIQVADDQTADLHIINTCTVTQKASMQSRQAVRRAIRSHADAQIIVTGCYAQTEPDAVAKISGVHQIIGHAYKHKIPAMIQPLKQMISASSPIIEHGVLDDLEFESPAITAFGNRSRPLLKIQDGCDSYCTYCVVPYARGPSRSMPVANVVKHIRRLKQAGYHEAVLCGIHLGAYGKDLQSETDLSSLLHHIEKLRIIDRIRLSSIEPHELTDDIIKLVAETDQFCRHFHIPLQSGDNDVLKKMNRPYKRSFVRDLVLKTNSLIPDAAVGIDILVGFPGETERAFDRTYSLIDELPVSYLHVFPFSARKGTPASKFLPKISANDIKARCQQIRRLGNMKKKRFYNKSIGKTFATLMEDNQSAAGFMKGTTSNYIPVRVPWQGAHKNALVDVRIDRVDADGVVFGTVC